MLSRQRLITTFRNGIARPYVLKTDARHLDLSSNLINLFEDSVGCRRFEIEDHIKSFNIEKITPKVVQGLSELLFKRSKFNEIDALNAVELRQTLFTASANYWKTVKEGRVGLLHHRSTIINNAGKQSNLPETVDESQLFGDISANQLLADFESITAEKLIHRFNIAQVQGLLLNSRSLELRVHRRNSPVLKQLLQMLKFFRLMFGTTDADENWITLQIDGPASVLENSRSYGLEIAQFFPAILLLKVPWQLTASLKVPNRRRIFTLEITEDNPYQSHYQTRNVWTNDKVTALLDRFNDKYSGKYHANSDHEIIPLRDNRYLLPDFEVTRIEKGKRGLEKQQMQIEWIHYPSEAKLKWIRQVKSQLPKNYVFAVRGKQEKLKPLLKTMDSHLLVYKKELTAPALVKKFEQANP